MRERKRVREKEREREREREKVRVLNAGNRTDRCVYVRDLSELE